MRIRNNVLSGSTQVKCLFCELVILTMIVSGCGFRTKMPFPSPAEEVIKATAQKAEIDSAVVVDDFIKKMVAKDVVSAYDLFSTRAKSKISLADAEKMIAGDNYLIFSDYDKLEVTDSSYGTHVELNSQVTYIQMTGVVTYARGLTGTFASTLEDENGKWRLVLIKVLAPPEKQISANPPEEEKLAEAVLMELRSRWNAGDFESIFENGAPSFRVVEQKAQIIAAMEQTFEQYGEFEKIIDSKIKVVITSPLQVRMAFHTQFHKAEAFERLTFVRINNGYKLGGYNFLADKVDLDELLSNKY